MSDDLNAAMRSSVIDAIRGIEETQEYGILAQTNETSALTIPTIETLASELLDQAAGETPQKKVVKLKELQNAQFYAIKLVVNEKVLLAVKKAHASWQTKKASQLISAFFEDEELGLDTRPSFELSRFVDFIVFGKTVFILNKSSFESVLNYKEAHRDDFTALQSEPEFAGLFSSIEPLVRHIGENKIQLRRASAIRQKAHYRNADFIQNLRRKYREIGLNISFDGNGRIVPTPESCGDIILAFLDHRLTSILSSNVYDVQDAVSIVSD